MRYLAKYHDLSKYQYPEFIPYVWLTWKSAKRSYDYVSDQTLKNGALAAAVTAATAHHLN